MCEVVCGDRNEIGWLRYCLLNACAVHADLPGIQLAHPFQLILSCGVLCSLCHPSGIISHCIWHLWNHFCHSNHIQHVPSPPGHPLGLQLHFGFILGCSMCCSLCHPSGTIPGTCGGHLVWLFFCPARPHHLTRYLQVWPSYPGSTFLNPWPYPYLWLQVWVSSRYGCRSIFLNLQLYPYPWLWVWVSSGYGCGYDHWYLGVYPCSCLLTKRHCVLKKVSGVGTRWQVNRDTTNKLWMQG